VILQPRCIIMIRRIRSRKFGKDYWNGWSL